MKENRLLHVMADDLAKQRAKAGAAPAPIVYNSRAADANATRQDLTKKSGPDTTPGPYAQSNADKLASANAGLNERNNVYGNASQGLGTTATRMDLDPKSPTYGQYTQFKALNTAEGMGAFAESSGARLAGQDYGQVGGSVFRGAYIDPLTGQPVKATADQVSANNADLKGAAETYGSTTPSLKDGAGAAGNDAVKRLTDIGVSDPAVLQKARDSATTGYYQSETARINAETAQQGKQRTDTAAKNTPSADTTSTPGQPDQAGQSADPTLNHLLSVIPEELKATLGPAIIAAYNTGDSSIKGATDLNATRTSSINDAFNKSDKRLEEQLTRSNANFADLKTFLTESRDQQDKLIADSQKSALEKLDWQDQKNVRTATSDLQQQMDEMQAQIATTGGIGSSNANFALSKAKMAGEQAIIDLQKETGFKKADTVAFFTAQTVQSHQEFAKEWVTAIDAHEATVNSIELAFNGNDQKRAELLDKAATDLYTATDAAKQRQADTLWNAALVVKQAIGEQKTADRQKEADALTRIEYLASNFAPEQVADQIRELAKDVKSFDATKLAGLAPLDVLKKLGRTGSGGGTGGLTLPGQKAAPLQTYDQYTQDKIAEKEAELGLSMDPKARKEYLDANKANFALEYKQSMAPSADSVTSSGDAAVDEVAKLVANGTVSIAVAAKQSGKPLLAIAQQVDRIQSAGVGGGFVHMTPEQNKSMVIVARELDKNPTAVFARQVPYKVAAIKEALSKRNGVSDLLAINNYQSGLVDPGATVRSEDVVLIAKQAAPLLAKYSTDYWKNKLTQGAILPEDVRQQLISMTETMAKVTQQAYEQGPYQRALQLGQSLGVPTVNLQQFRSIDFSLDDAPPDASGGSLEEDLTTLGY